MRFLKPSWYYTNSYDFNYNKNIPETATQSRWIIYFYTIIICLNHTAFGMTLTMFAPVMVDMKYILNTSMQWISLYQTFQSIGYITGTLFGLLYKYLSRQLTTSIFLILTSISCALLPNSTGLAMFYMCAWFIGLGAGSWNSIINVWLIEIWKDKSAPLLQFVQFSFGIGTIFSPLLLKSHLKGERNQTEECTTGANITGVNEYNITIIDDCIEYKSTLWLPFLITGVIQIIFPLLLMLMYFINQYQIPSSVRICPNSSTIDPERKLFDRKESPRFLIIFIFAVWLSTYCVMESTILNFGATYLQYSPLKLSARNAAEMVSVIALSFTIGRGISIFISMKIKPQFMIGYHFVLLYFSIAILILWGQYSLPVLWIANVCIGVGLSALFPAMFAFLEQYIEITNPIGTCVIFCSDLFNLFNPYVLGLMVEKHSMIVIVFEIMYLLLCSTIFLIILCIIRSYNMINEHQVNNVSKNVITI